MNRKEFEIYINENYNCNSDTPWVKYPNHRVFRHPGNSKWFALVMEIPKEKLGINDTGFIDVANFKCDPIMVTELVGKKGIYPAYHMSKDKWISVALDGSADENIIKMLIDISFDLTKPKINRKGAFRETPTNKDMGQIKS